MPTFGNAEPRPPGGRYMWPRFVRGDMRRVVLFIATSADGFIAREDGAIDWLPSGDGSDYGYHAFIKRVDTLLMGRRTYEQLLTIGPFPYPDKRTYVFTRKKRIGDSPRNHPSVRFVDEDPVFF